MEYIEYRSASPSLACHLKGSLPRAPARVLWVSEDIGRLMEGVEVLGHFFADWPGTRADTISPFLVTASGKVSIRG